MNVKLQRVTQNIAIVRMSFHIKKRMAPIARAVVNPTAIQMPTEFKLNVFADFQIELDSLHCLTNTLGGLDPFNTLQSAWSQFIRREMDRV